MKALALLAILLAPLAHAQQVQLTIKTLQAQMRYDVSDLQVPPGASVKIVFENTDDMPHNLVFFQPGTDVVAVCNKQMEKPEEALKRNWLPEDPRMWLHSKMLNPKEREEITFKAPEKTGAYPFVCSFPGHAMTMQGTLRIVAPGPKLTSLHFAMYLGAWKELPDFAKLTPFREGELDGLVEIKLDDYKNDFGLVYTGKLKAPREADYTFQLACDDGARLSIDGKKIVEHDGIHPAGDIKEGKVKLKAGEHDFRLEYFQAGGQAELFVAWSGGGFSFTPLSKWVHPNAKGAGPRKKKDAETTGMPIAVGKEPVIYRNFIAGAGKRSIGVGYPGGFNVAFDAEVMNTALLWRGAFIDAARHWNSRGGGAQPPLGFDVLRLQPALAPAFAVPGANGEWPQLGANERPAGFAWKGYMLDAKRAPTFRYEWNGVKIAERFDTAGKALDASGKLVRTLTLSGAIPEGAMFCAATAGKIEASDGGFIVDDGRLTIDKTSYDNRFKVAVEGGKIVGGKLLVPARPKIEVTYSWLTAHGGHHAH